MAALAMFLHDVLFEGRISLHTLPEGDDPAAPRVLLEAYNTYVLSIAGPRLPFARLLTELRALNIGVNSLR